MSQDILPTVLVPGLQCSARLFAGQIPLLWRYGPVQVADHARDATMQAIAARILANAPPRFALAGLSMGGYIAMEIMRQAPERVAKLALLDTSSRPYKPDPTQSRERLIALAKSGDYDKIAPVLFPSLVHPARQNDAALRAICLDMAVDVGVDGYLRQQNAIMTRDDYRPSLAKISCPALVLVGDADGLTPPEVAEEIAQSIAGARLVVVPECGHMSTMERPDAVNAALAEWMEA